ncbi:hypothetical protein CLF_104240 [Clonorchis sinensis]|uniref:Uncharacterized protein n=1 Tax=Clonorchis sinensis TaxID=79923 RepID=G7YB77_CLOSI|nr:hypothetical protein CLF_104240 [Clonorchis sinensis]
MNKEQMDPNRISQMNKGFWNHQDERQISAKNKLLAGLGNKPSIRKNWVSSEVKILQGNEVKHHETRFIVHGFKVGNHFRSTSLNTLNVGYVVRASGVGNLVGISRRGLTQAPENIWKPMLVMWERMRRIIRKTTSVF